MTADQWRRVEALLPQALERPAAERRAFLDDALADDPALRAEMDALLAAHERTGLLDGDLTRPSLPAGPSAGSTIGHYRIGEPLGAGGMGVVYRARDVRLERTVALKFLPFGMGEDADAKQRFLTEARAAAALDHPNVCSVHDIGETDDGRLYIAMAFVEGETLAAILRHGPLDIDRAIHIAYAVASALHCAHTHGVVHRDVKPGNVMIGTDGTVKLVDFGIAKRTGTPVTRGGTPGTMAYMSPEQVHGEPVDGRSDVWALGVVLYEMLVGRRPFDAATDAAQLRTILETSPQRPRTLRPELPAALDAVVMQALEKDRTRRFASAEAFGDALRQAAGRDVVARVRPRRAHRALIVGACLVAAALVVMGVRAWRRAAVSDAFASLPRIAQLAAAGRHVEAYAEAVRAEHAIGGDTTLRRLMPVIADRITVISEPPGARVWLRRVEADGTLANDSMNIGATPLRDVRVARADYQLVLRLDGHSPVERIASSALNRAEASLGVAEDVTVHVKLHPRDQVPPGMVFVPGSDYALVGREAPTHGTVALRDFHIDAHEVTNARFREFIVAGGYSDPRFWQHPFILDGVELSWNDAMRRLVDRTGLPGPRGWVGQEHPAGEAAHPVTGVTWYEAAAYAAFREKRLPTLFEWEKAARDGRYTHFEQIVMPWGLADPARGIAGRANFASEGTSPVDAHPAGLSPWGAYDMAGNVEEWLANPSGEQRFIAGGAWDDPMYVFANYLPLSAFHASATIGFRCASDAQAGDGDNGAIAIAQTAPTPEYVPVDDATFRTLLQHYAYDRTPLNARIEARVQTEDWTRETIHVDGPWQDATVLYLYVPARSRPPFQTVVLVPGTNTFFEAPLDEETEHIMGAHVKAGRAVLSVLFKGMVGRPWDEGRTVPAPPSVQFRQELVAHATELRRALDYIETRDDVDTARIAYVGFSRGSGSWLPFAAVDPRFRSVVLIGGGIDERLQPVLPEASSINFAPRIAAPTLLLNGTWDEEHPWTRRALPLWRLLSEPKRLQLVDGGHLPPAEVRVPAINAWLDETLGPVRR